MHETNIETIQNETLKIIDITKNLLNEVVSSGITNGQESTLSEENLKLYLEALNNGTEKVKNLEFVITVVGTMKAGKSTTINAIVGQEILPNRSFPMTALPTLVTHKLGQTEPELFIPKIDPLIKLVKEISTKLEIHQCSSEFLGSKDGKQIESLIRENKIMFESKYQGQDEIFFFLKTINDLMRTAKDLDIEPPYEEFVEVNELPRIEVEFYHLKHIKNVSESRLSILDTPGPNEFKHSKHLKKVFKKQMHLASAIMLVMDYTIMNSKSDDEVRTQVKEITDLIGKERMFVLLNKFDEKGKNDSDYDETREHVAKYLLGNQIDIDNIYPVSSKIAFWVNRGLSEIDKNGHIDSELSWIEDFGEEIIGRRWEKKIDDIEEVKACCKDAWEEDSYFEKPLDNIIVHAHAKSAIGSISVALSKLLEISKQLDNAFKTRKDALTKDIETLKSNVEKIQEDIIKIDKISESIKQDIEKNLNLVYSKLKKLAKEELDQSKKQISNIFEIKKEAVDDLFVENAILERDRGLLGFFFEKKEVTRKEIENAKKDDLRKFLKDGEIKFNSKEEAEVFVFEIQKKLEKKVKNILTHSEKIFKSEIKNFIPLINGAIKNNLGELIEEIQSRIGGNVDIGIPKISFKKNKISVKNVLESTIDENIETQKRSVVTNRFFNIFNDNWGRDTVSYDVKTFNVTKTDIQNKIDNVFKTVVKTIQNNTESIYINDIEEVVFKSIQKLSLEIEGYRGEMLAILKNRETDEVNIKDEILKAKINQDKSSKIIKRINTSISVLNEMDNNNE